MTGGDVGNPTNHKNHTNHSSDNSLRALSVLRGQSPSFQSPTRHSGGGRNPEGRGRGESQKSQNPQFRQLPSRPFVSFVDNPRHSNRPPVIPAAAGIQRGGAAGHPTNHKNPTNHSSDNPLRAPSCPSWTIPVIPTAHPSFRRRPESRGAGTWGIPPITKTPRITVQTTPFAPLSVLRGQSPSFRPPHTVIPAKAGIQGRGRGESH